MVKKTVAKKEIVKKEINKPVEEPEILLNISCEPRKAITITTNKRVKKYGIIHFGSDRWLGEL